MKLKHVVVEKATFRNEILKMKEREARLMVIVGVQDRENDKFQMIYSFEENHGDFTNIKVNFGWDDTIPSIQDIYISAMLPEMEVVDLFDVKVEGVAHGLLLEPDKYGILRKKGADAKAPAAAAPPPAAKPPTSPTGGA